MDYRGFEPKINFFPFFLNIVAVIYSIQSYSVSKETIDITVSYQTDVLVQQFVQKCQCYYTLSDQRIPLVTIISNVSLLTEQLWLHFNHLLHVIVPSSHIRLKIPESESSKIVPSQVSFFGAVHMTLVMFVP